MYLLWIYLFVIRLKNIQLYVMNLLKRIFKFLLGLLLALILILVAIPYFFKDDLVEIIKDEANLYLTGELEFSDIDLSLLSSFPDLQIEIKDVSISGSPPFKTSTLAKAKKILLNFDLISALKSSEAHSINEFTVQNGVFNIQIDGENSNYNILKSSSDSGDSNNLELKIKKYAFEDCQLTYSDNQFTDFRMDSFNHLGSADILGDQIRVYTKTTSNLSLRNEGIRYLKDAKLISNLDLIFYPNSNRILLDKNDIQLNDLNSSITGEIISEEDINIDLRFESKESSTKSILSLIPGVYTRNYHDIQSEGKASFNGMLLGVFNANKDLYPEFRVEGKIKDGAISRKNTSSRITELNTEFSLSSGKNRRNLNLNVPSFRMQVDESELEAKFLVSNLESDPLFEGNINGLIELSHFNDLFLSEEIDLKGLLDTDLDLRARESQITNKTGCSIQWRFRFI